MVWACFLKHLCDVWRSIKEAYQREVSGLVTLALLIGLAYSFPENEGPLELSGGCLLTCFFFVCIEPRGCSGGTAPSIPAQMDSSRVVHLNWQMCQCAMHTCSSTCTAARGGTREYFQGALLHLYRLLCD